MTTSHSDPSRGISAPESGGLRYGCYAALLLTICFFAAIRFHLRSMPLERDEGEYAYIGQLMLQGVPPYSLAGNMKLPGTHAAYAVMMAVFGQTASGIRIGLLLANAVTSVLLFFLAKRLYGSLAAAVAGCTYAFLSCRAEVLGVHGHATHFVVFWALAGILFLLWAIDTGRVGPMFGSGVCFGLAFLMKQPGILFGVFAGAYWVWRESQRPVTERRFAIRGGVFLAGAVLPFGLTCLILLHAGVFASFWFWTWSYALEYGSEISFLQGWKFLGFTLPSAVSPFVIWAIVVLGLTAPLWSRWARTHRTFVAGFFLSSALAVCAGFYFRSHYFILILPAAALSTGLGVSAVWQEMSSRGFGTFLTWFPVACFAIVFAICVQTEYRTLLRLDPLALNQKVGGTPFAEAVEAGEYIKLHSSTQDTIGIIGSEPEICFYAGLRCATGYLYFHPLLERQSFARKMQSDFMRQLRGSHPRFVVFVGVENSWLWQPALKPNMDFLEEAWDYCHSGYTLVKQLPIGADNQPQLRADQAAIYIFRSDEPQP